MSVSLYCNTWAELGLDCMLSRWRGEPFPLVLPWSHKVCGSCWAVLPLGFRLQGHWQAAVLKQTQSAELHPSDATALLTWVISVSHPSNDTENMWVNCQREDGEPLKSLGSRSGLRSSSNLLWKFRAAYLCVCSHLHCTCQQKKRRPTDDASVSWELNPLSSSCLSERTAAAD